MLFVVVFAVALFTSHGAKLPPNWTVCKLSDPKMADCIKKAIGIALKDFSSRAPVIEGVTLDPLHFEKLAINQGTGPISINLNFKDADFRGVKDARIDKVEGNWKKMDVQFNIPLMSFKGNYKINGKVLLLPITGEGNSEMKIHKFRATAHLKFQEKVIGKKRYYQVQNLNFDWDTGKFEIFLDNLFNGDKVLGANMNKFLNENSREILNELKPSITKAFTLSIASVANRILSKFSKDDVSPP